MGAFFHAVAVFVHHLRQVEWIPLGLALACHVTKLLFRGRAWQNIIRASYPADRLKYRSALGAYIAGVGVNSIAPARGGDVVKLYLVKRQVKESTYPTLASSLVVETLFDFAVASVLFIWAIKVGLLPGVPDPPTCRPSTGPSSSPTLCSQRSSAASSSASQSSGWRGPRTG